MRKLIPAILVGFTFLQCQKEKQLQQIDVDIKSISTVNLSEIAKNSTSVILETNDSCLLSTITDVVSAGNYYFVLSSNIYQFDKKGKFVRQVGRQGKGPSEYLYINAITADETNGILYVATGQQLLCFDFNGALLKEMAYRKFVENMECSNDELLVIASKMAIKQNEGYRNETKLYRLNRELKCNDSILVKSVNFKSASGVLFPQANYISDLRNQRFLYFPVLLPETVLRDTLYEIKDNQLHPSLRLNIDGVIVKGDTKNLSVMNIYRSSRYLFLEYALKDGPRFFCADLKINRTMNMRDGFTDDLDHTGIAKLRPLNLKSDLMLFIKQGYELNNVIEGVTENSNPVIFLVNLRN